MKVRDRSCIGSLWNTCHLLIYAHYLCCLGIYSYITRFCNWYISQDDQFMNYLISLLLYIVKFTIRCLPGSVIDMGCKVLCSMNTESYSCYIVTICLFIRYLILVLLYSIKLTFSKMDKFYCCCIHWSYLFFIAYILLLVMIYNSWTNVLGSKLSYTTLLPVLPRIFLKSVYCVAHSSNWSADFTL